ncbi:MAG: glycoside hydrolase family 99-like domain-containing protein [bacterium]
MKHFIYSAIIVLSLAFLAVNTTCFGETAENRSVSNGCNVGAYYYPWYGDDFHGHHYIRERLVPPQKPELGEYNDSDPKVIAKHIEWSRYAGVGFWAASWWGPDSREDKTLREVILPHPNLGQLKIAVHYETAGRTKDFTDYEYLYGDFLYLSRNYFNNPGYLRIEGKPVVFVYLTRVLAQNGQLKDALMKMRSGARDGGYEIYIVGDHAFGAYSYLGVGFKGLDAITDYDVYGSIGVKGYAGEKALSAYMSRQSKWKKMAVKSGVDYFPSVTPGFNDAGVRDGHPPLSRKLTEDAPFGSLFEAMLRNAKNLQTPNKTSFIMVTSWNEWHEDTQIEPVEKASPITKDDSKSGDALTYGLEYDGYGMLYLDVLKTFCGN